MLVMGAKLQTWMTLAPLNVGFGADVGANRRGGLPDLLGGLESEFLAGDHRLGGRVEFVGDVAQVVGVFANVVRRFGEVAGIAACGACWRAFHGFGQCDRILQGFERGAVRHVIHGEFRCFSSFLSRFFKALLMRGERLRIQRAGVAGGLCHFALVGDCDDGDGCERDGSYCDHGDDGDGLALFHIVFLHGWLHGGSSLLVWLSFQTKRCEYTKNTSEKRFTAGNNADYFAVKGICL